MDCMVYLLKNHKIVHWISLGLLALHFLQDFNALWLRSLIVAYVPSLKLTCHLNMDGWNTSFLLGWHIFRGYYMILYVSVREGRYHLLFDILIFATPPQMWKIPMVSMTAACLQIWATCPWRKPCWISTMMSLDRQFPENFALQPAGENLQVSHIRMIWLIDGNHWYVFVIVCGCFMFQKDYSTL